MRVGQVLWRIDADRAFPRNHNTNAHARRECAQLLEPLDALQYRGRQADVSEQRVARVRVNSDVTEKRGAAQVGRRRMAVPLVWYRRSGEVQSGAIIAAHDFDGGRIAPRFECAHGCSRRSYVPAPQHQLCRAADVFLGKSTALSVLEHYGYTNLHLIEGGWSAWQAAGYPIADGAGAR